MSYLVAQIVLCLLAAAVLGALAGSVLRGARARRALALRENTWRMTLEVKDEELADALQRADGATVAVEALEASASDTRVQLADLDTRAADAERTRQRLEVELGERQEELDACRRRLSAVEQQIEGAERVRRELDAARDELREARELTGSRDAQITSLREQIESCAAAAARLEGRIGELEPRLVEAGDLERKLAELTAEADARTEEHRARLRELDARLEQQGEFRAAVAERDRSLNEIRARFHDALVEQERLSALM